MQMRPFLYFRYIIPILCVTTFSACDKNSSTAPTPTPGVWGQMIAGREYRTVIAGTDTAALYKETANALFYAQPNPPYSFIDGGHLQLNNTDIARLSSNEYYAESETGYGLSTHMQWHCSGNGNVPAGSYEDTSAFPSYTASLPYSIDKSSGVSFVLNTATIAHADSVRIIINDGTGSGSGYLELTYPADTGTITIPPAVLTSLADVNDHTGIIGVIPYSGIVKIFSNKGFYFVRESKYYQAVNID